MSPHRLEYSAPAPIDRKQANALFDAGLPEPVQEALVSIALLENDLEWAYSMIVRGARMSDPGIRGTALLCLGHLARIHGRLPNGDEAVSLINEGLEDEDPYVRGQSENAADDLEIFVPTLATGLKQRPQPELDDLDDEP